MKANIWKIKKYCEVRDYCQYTGEYRGAVDSICNLKYGVPKLQENSYSSLQWIELWLPFYYKIIKELVEEYKKQFTCLGENI